MTDIAGHPVTDPPPEDQVRDEEGRLRDEFVERVSAAVGAGDGEQVRALAGDLHEADMGALIEALDTGHRPRLIELLGDDFDFSALTEVDDSVREEILEEISNEEIAEGVRELESDDAVAILEDLDPEDRAEVLQALPLVERTALRRSLDYPENSAGRLMQTTLIAVPAFWNVGQTIDYMREADAESLPDSFFEVFVVDPGHRFLGTVFLDKLTRSKRPVRLDSIMQEDRRRVSVMEDREEVARLFERYNLISVPVVDEAARLVGVITIDDIVDVIQEEAEEDLRALGGVSRREELSDPVLWITRSRFLWLLVNLATAFIASSVLGLFESQLQKMVALAVLAPIVASQGGNAATQTMTVAVRALATRDLSPSNAAWIITRELTVGAINGAAFGLITGIISATWFHTPGIGIVIALAMLTNLIAGALGGILIPLLLDGLKVDPAVSSGAFVTTVTDVVGYASFLSIATLWFGLA
ncbi:MAG: magnesium transporter [Methylobacteriaceae bacterium]|nr:magnesium transporter [Methylobacteriaceae bacterium]